MKQFLSVHDIPNIDEQVQLALQLKANPYQFEQMGKHRRIGIIFLNPSLRTRLSTMIAAQNLGMTPIVLNMNNESWALEFDLGAIMNGTSVEHIADAAPILGQYFDILAIRTFPGLKDRDYDYSEMVLEQFKKYSGIPILSLESATLHPLQSLADTITITEHLPQLNKKPKVVLAWAPHIKALPQCVANSFAQWMSAWDAVDLTIAHPKGFDLKEEYTKGSVITNDLNEALSDADFVYVKNWSSYNDYGKVYEAGSDWMLDENKMKVSNYGKVMHCLPVRRNLELSGALIDSPSSLIQQQAGNRVWSAQSVIYKMLEAL
jgi:N-succinyl-L-ornithine transcarbamylase